MLKIYQHLTATNVYVSTRQQVCAKQQYWLRLSYRTTTERYSRKTLRTASTPLFSLLDVLGDQGPRAVRYVAFNASCVHWNSWVILTYALGVVIGYSKFKNAVVESWNVNGGFYFVKSGLAISLLLLHSTSNFRLKMLF